MELAVQGNDDQLTVTVIGEVMAEATHDLRDAMNDLIASRQPKEIILELSKMTFIESSGLGVLVGLRGLLRKSGTNLILAHPQPRVLEIFRMTRLTMLFDIIE